MANAGAEGIERIKSLFQLVYNSYKELEFRMYYARRLDRSLNPAFSFYRSLPASIKMKFLRTVRDKYEFFEFVPRGGMKLTFSMKATIAGGAAQLALFLPPESLSFCRKILVYPDYYDSRITGKRHKGEVNPGLRIIVFSWRGVVECLDRDDDGLNLLLHEFAHGLWLEHELMGLEYKVLEDAIVQQFEKFALNEMNKLENNEHHFFRKYAFQNIDEFFAVAVENFFERPKQLIRELPELYPILAGLFKQDRAKETKI